MKNKMMMLMVMVALCCSSALVGCDEVETHREADLAPRTVQQTEVIAP